MHGISALGRNGQPSDNAQDLFNKTMLAINNWANKAPTGSETADTLKVCVRIMLTIILILMQKFCCLKIMWCIAFIERILSE